MIVSLNQGCSMEGDIRIVSTYTILHADYQIPLTISSIKTSTRYEVQLKGRRVYNQHLNSNVIVHRWAIDPASPNLALVSAMSTFLDTLWAKLPPSSVHPGDIILIHFSFNWRFPIAEKALRLRRSSPVLSSALVVTRFLQLCRERRCSF